jgi:hypothetical protein
MPRARQCQAPDATWMGRADHANLGHAGAGGAHRRVPRLAGRHAAARRNAHGRLADAGEPELRGGRVRSACLTYEIGPYLERMRTEDIATLAAEVYEVVEEA